jgi:hypothetical protein
MHEACEDEKFVQNFHKKSGGKRSSVRHRCRWENNQKMDLKKLPGFKKFSIGVGGGFL